MLTRFAKIAANIRPATADIAMAKRPGVGALLSPLSATPRDVHNMHDPECGGGIRATSQ